VKAYGYLAEFSSLAQLMDARDRLLAAGYVSVDVFTPWDTELRATQGRERPTMGHVMGFAFALGVLGTLLMQYVAATSDYPLNIGGRPPASWPAFVPAALEVGMLLAAGAAVGVFLWRTGLPRWYRPEFNVAWFEEASRAGFLLMVRAEDARWDPRRCHDDVAALTPMRHCVVPA
jgi:hypothetical protein